MRSTTSFLVSLLSATAFALPQTTVHPGQTSPWTVTQYTIGCSPGGCTYSFDIEGPDTPGFGGAFSTLCSGTDVQNKLVNCTDTQFSANLTPEPNGQVLSVLRAFPYGGETDLAGGNVTTGSSGTVPPSTFIIDARVYGQIVTS